MCHNYLKLFSVYQYRKSSPLIMQMQCKIQTRNMKIHWRGLAEFGHSCCVLQIIMVDNPRAKLLHYSFNRWFGTILGTVTIVVHVRFILTYYKNQWSLGYHYLSTLANMLLQMERNCMILSSRWRSSSPLNKYVYLNKRRKQTEIVLTTASVQNIAIYNYSEQTVSRNETSRSNLVWPLTRSNVG